MSYIEFDPCPYNTSGAQVGWTNYHLVGLLEAKTMIKQICEMFGLPPTEVSIRVCSVPHDFGSYYEIRITESDYAYDVDEKFPEEWTKKSLGILNEECQRIINKTYEQYILDQG